MLTIRMRTVVAALLLFALSAGAWAQQSPSLGDLARQKRSGKKAKRVITDEDLPSSTAGVTLSSVGSLDPVSPTGAVPASADGQSSSDKPAFSSEQSGGDELERLKKLEEAVQNNIKEIEAALAGGKIGSIQRHEFEKSLRERREFLATVQKDRAALEAGRSGSAAAAQPPQQPVIK
jgi:hypothetical protein